MSVQHPPTITGAEHPLQADLLEAFDRFFTVGSFYPADHSQCQRALSDFYEAIDKIIPTGEAMILEPAQGGIRVQGIYLDQSHTGVQNLYSMFEALGLARLKIIGNAPLQELHSMVTTLNSLKLEAGSFQSFNSLDFEKLPNSVEVEQRKFGWRQFQMGSDQAISEKLLHHMNQLMDQVQQQPWSDARKEEFRHQAESFLLKTVERMETGMVRSTQAQRTLEEVLMLGASVVENAISSLQENEDGRSINQVFNQAAESLAYGNDKETLDMMFEVLNEGASQNSSHDSQETNLPQPDQSTYSQSIAELAEKAMQLAAQATEPEISSADHSLEILSITLKMLSEGAADGLAKSLQKTLFKELSLPVSSAKIDSLEESLRHLLMTGDRIPVDHVLPLLLPHLLRNNSEALAQFLGSVAPTDHPEKLSMVWPHLVGMMLMEKPPQNKAMLEYLIKAITALPLANVKEEAHRLDFLTVIQTGKIGTAILQWPVHKSHAVLVALLAGRQSNQIGQRLNRFWMDKAPNKLAGVLMRVLGPFETGHQKLYTTILDFSTTGNLDRANREYFSRLIQTRLEGLEAPERNSSWVPHALGELGNLGCTENLEFLQRVVNQKRLIFRHVWSREARQAAVSGLQKISQTTPGDKS